MQQFAYKNKLFITGKIGDVTEYLRILAGRYRTVREYIEELTRGM